VKHDKTVVSCKIAECKHSSEVHQLTAWHCHNMQSTILHALHRAGHRVWSPGDSRQSMLKALTH